MTLKANNSKTGVVSKARIFGNTKYTTNNPTNTKGWFFVPASCSLCYILLGAETGKKVTKNILVIL